MEIQSECTEHTGSVNRITGYGKVTSGRLAHRAEYEKHNGPIPPGMVVRHKCDNRICVNIDHLVIGTQQDNINDCIERGRFPKGERQGSARFSDKQVAHIKWRVLVCGETCTAVSQEHNVSRSTIGHMKSGRNWPHIAPEESTSDGEEVQDTP